MIYNLQRTIYKVGRLIFLNGFRCRGGGTEGTGKKERERDAFFLGEAGGEGEEIRLGFESGGGGNAIGGYGEAVRRDEAFAVFVQKCGCISPDVDGQVVKRNPIDGGPVLVIAGAEAACGYLARDNVLVKAVGHFLELVSPCLEGSAVALESVSHPGGTEVGHVVHEGRVKS
jgi:hypothetical protein